MDYAARLRGMEQVTERGTWKASERRMAAILGGQRVPVSGRERGHQPDIDGVTVAGRRLAIEHKYGAALLSARINEAFKQARAAARSGEDIPIVTIEDTGHGVRNLRAVILEAETFAAVVDWYRQRLSEAEVELVQLRGEVAAGALACARCGGRIIISEAACVSCGRGI